MDSMSGELENGPEFRQRAAEADLQEVYAAIFNHNGEFEPQEASSLAFRLVVDMAEVGVHVGDKLSLQAGNDADDIPSRLAELETARLRESQPVLMGVIADAQTGDLTSTRRFVVSLARAPRGSDPELIRKTSSNSDVRHRRAMLLRLASAIPNRGPRVVLPKPAWERARTGT